MKLDNHMYNKTKLIHELGSMVWFLEKHALKDAQVADDQECISVLTNLKNDLQKHADKLQEVLHNKC